MRAFAGPALVVMILPITVLGHRGDVRTPEASAFTRVLVCPEGYTCRHADYFEQLMAQDAADYLDLSIEYCRIYYDYAMEKIEGDYEVMIEDFSDPFVYSGAHVPSHATPDILFSEHWTLDGGVAEFADTMIHEAAHHFGAGEGMAKILAEGCRKPW